MKNQRSNFFHSGILALLATTAMAGMVGLAEPAQSAYQRPNAAASGLSGSWNILFEDEFDSTELDKTKWGTCFSNFGVSGTNDCKHDQAEQEVYTPTGVTVSNGSAVLTANNTPTDGQKYASGMIVTGPSAKGGSGSLPIGSASNFQGFSFQHGYVEIRAQVPSGPGLWPAFWLLDDDGSYPPEIDIFEILDTDTTVDHMHFHPATGPNANPDGGGSGDTISPGNDFTASTDLSKDYHIYGLDWEPGSLTWYLDGKQIGQYNNDNNDISTKAQYIIINLAVGGDYPTGNPANGIYPASMKIDYVRAWEHCTSNCSTVVPVGAPIPTGGSSGASPTPTATPTSTPSPTPTTVTTPIAPTPTPSGTDPVSNPQPTPVTTPIVVSTPTPVTGTGTSGTSPTPIIPVTTTGAGSSSISALIQELQQIEQEITALIQQIQSQLGQGNKANPGNKSATDATSPSVPTPTPTPIPTPRPGPTPRPVPTISCKGEFNCR